eukprot:scaffold74900_cov46-Cyclotella_meneghiniana.AAC.1
MASNRSIDDGAEEGWEEGDSDGLDEGRTATHQSNRNATILQFRRRHGQHHTLQSPRDILSTINRPTILPSRSIRTPRKTTEPTFEIPIGRGYAHSLDVGAFHL